MSNASKGMIACLESATVKPNPTLNWMERMLSHGRPTTRQVVQTSIKTNDGGAAPVPLAPDSVWCSFCQAGHCIPANQAFIVGAPATAP
jgi:hypothetical protein